MSIRNWSTTPASNNSAAPFGAPEGSFKFSEINDVMRQIMADMRSYVDDAQFTPYGHSVSFIDVSHFKAVGGNYLSVYQTGRRIKAFVGAGEVVGDVASATFAGGETTVQVTLDAGVLDSSMTSVAVGIVTPTGNGIPKNLDLWAGSRISTSAIAVQALTAATATINAASISALDSDRASISSLAVTTLTLAGRKVLDGDVSIVAGAVHSPNLASHGKMIVYTNPGGCAVTLPDISASALPNGWWLGQINQTSGSVIDNAAVIDDGLFTHATSLMALALPSAGDGGRLICDAASKRFYWQGKRSKVSQFPYDTGTLTALAHGLGVVPDMVDTYLVCTTADMGYSISDMINTDNVTVNAPTGYNYQMGASAITVRMHSSVPQILNKATYSIGAIVAGSWSLRVISHVEN